MGTPNRVSLLAYPFPLRIMAKSIHNPAFSLFLRIAWGAGCLCIALMGIGMISLGASVSGLISIALSIFLFPPVFTRIKLTRALKIGVALALFLVSIGLAPELPDAPTSASEPNLSEQNLQKIRETSARQKEEMDTRNDRHWTAYSCSKQYIVQLLKNPRGADFSPKAETRYFENEQGSTISGWVDATNSFGGVVRTPWACAVTFTESTCKVDCDLQ